MHRLETHVGHPERVAVRVTDGDPEPSHAGRHGNREAGVRPLEPGFPGPPSLGPLVEDSAHADFETGSASKNRMRAQVSHAWIE